MGFMEKQVTGLERWVEIDGTSGTTAVPYDILSSEEIAIAESVDGDANEPEDLQAHFGDYYDGKVWSVTTRQGYGARLSAPGYMDCTEWSVFDTKAEAREYLEDMYGDDEDDSEDGDEDE